MLYLYIRRHTALYIKLVHVTPIKSYFFLEIVPSLNMFDNLKRGSQNQNRLNHLYDSQGSAERRFVMLNFLALYVFFLF